MTRSDRLSSVVVVDRGDETLVRSLADAAGVDVEVVSERGLEPISTISLALIGAALAVNTVRDTLEARRGGQVIDLRPQAAKSLYRTRDLEYGIVVVIAVDGALTVRIRRTGDQLGRALSSLPRLLKAGDGIAEATETIESELGEDAQIVDDPDAGP